MTHRLTTPTRAAVATDCILAASRTSAPVSRVRVTCVSLPTAVSADRMRVT